MYSPCFGGKQNRIGFGAYPDVALAAGYPVLNLHENFRLLDGGTRTII